MESSKFQVILLLCVMAPPLMVLTVKEQLRRQQIMSLRPFELPGTVTMFHTTSFCGCDRVLEAARKLQQQGYRIKMVNMDTNRLEAEASKIRYSPTYVYYRDGQEQKRVESRLYERDLEELVRGLR